MTVPAPPTWVRELARSLRYALVGGGVQLIYLAVMAGGVALGWAYGWAMAAGQVVAILVAFPLQRHFVFAPGGTLWGDLGRFLTVWGAGSAVGIVGTVVLVEWAHWHPVVAQAVVIGVAALVVYAGQYKFTFRKRTGGASGGASELG